MNKSLLSFYGPIDDKYLLNLVNLGSQQTIKVIKYILNIIII